MDEVRLADGRKKARWSTDPRGMAWVNDKEKFGYRMLMKMGWSDGSGLGLNLHGQTKHVRVSARKDTTGLGSTDDPSSNWVGHQDDFNGILASLQRQSGSEPASAEQSGRSSPVHGLQAKASQTRSRINYSKFLRSKDLSSYSNLDLNCILGTQNKNDESMEEESVVLKSCEVTTANFDDNELFKTITSEQSVHDYFAAKLAKLRGGQASVAETSKQQPTNDDREESPSSDSTSRKKHKKSKRERRKEKQADEEEEEEEETPSLANGRGEEKDSGCDEETDEHRKRKKKKKEKSKKRKHKESSEDEDDVQVISKKKKKAKHSQEVSADQGETRTQHKKKKKKKKKREE